ncbi:signal peptidase I [Aeromicrobium sp. Marseille-Q0843]|uniref:Signal peptidase I n=1 Tax=Aeromicrobium phoceense TaxID=2754045 RepID=A0A838XL35_9ACTN|nr:signal peptidase I [Aeromicrobium phoceense]MBA4609326.1 signal peptidase I [Aeromicrobium phoceense]
MRQRLLRVLRTGGNVLLWVTAFLGAMSLVLGLATVVAGVQPLIFRSSSMEPAIHAGALGLAKTVDAGDVAVGDVISVESASGVRVTHRVVEVEKAGEQISFTLRGDANAQPDSQPYLATEVDRVFLDVPYLGYVANAMATPWALFAAGIIVALLAVRLWQRAGRETRSAMGTGAAGVAAVGIAMAGLVPIPRTEAYFTDGSTFEAGQIHSHQVRIFDWGSPVCTNDAGGTSITLRTLVASQRYNQIWYVAPAGGQLPATPFRRVSPTGVPDSVVTTQIRRADIGGSSLAPGNYELTGRSELKGTATSPWLSNATRTANVSLTGTTDLQCGSVNLPPAITFTTPQDSTTFASPSAAQSTTLAQCGRRSPCGTAADSDGIYRVEYRLQRVNFLLTRCWDTTFGWPVFSGCGTWHQADVTPTLPTSTASPVTWRVPLTNLGTSPFAEAGTYTLYLRVYDNSSSRVITERTIRFTIN